MVLSGLGTTAGSLWMDYAMVGSMAQVCCPQAYYRRVSIHHTGLLLVILFQELDSFLDLLTCLEYY